MNAYLETLSGHFRANDAIRLMSNLSSERGDIFLGDIALAHQPSRMGLAGGNLIGPFA